VFLARRRDRCKILFWDRGGLVLYYKRLERGRFRMPRVTSDGRSVEMDATELMMLLDGIDVRYVRRAEHCQPTRKKRLEPCRDRHFTRDVISPIEYLRDVRRD
jgi:transposase